MPDFRFIFFRYTDEGGKEKASDHPLYFLLHDEPNPEMTSFVFRETLMTHLLLWGNSYAQIIRNGNGRKRNYSSNHCFSQLIFCGDCGRIHWNNRGCKSIVWRCESRLQNTGVVCRARTVNEEFLQGIILTAINEMILDKSGYMEILQNNIATVIRNDASTSTTDIDARLLELQKELLKKANNRDAYDNVADEIFQLRELKSKSETDSVLRDEKLARITQICDFLKEQPGEIMVFDESLVRRLLQKITVFDDHFMVEFKSGVSVDIKK